MKPSTRRYMMKPTDPYGRAWLPKPDRPKSGGLLDELIKPRPGGSSPRLEPMVPRLPKSEPDIPDL